MSTNSEEPSEAAREARRIRRMVRQLYQLSEHASLTGAFSNGAAEAAERYNGIITYLMQLGIVSGPLFPALTGEMSWDRVAIACRLLEGYLMEETRGSGEGSSGGGGNNKIVIQGIGNLEELDRLKDIGRTIRESMPEDLGRTIRESLPDFMRRPRREEETTPPPPPPPPPTPDRF